MFEFIGGAIALAIVLFAMGGVIIQIIEDAFEDMEI